MRISCLVGGHAAFPGGLRNQGFYFSTCRRCRRDMVRSRSAWRLVPRGFRVVWKGGRRMAGEDSAFAGIRNLPVLAPLALGFAGDHWRHARRGAWRDILFAAWRMLLWTCADRARAWRQALALWLRGAPRVLALPAPSPGG